MNLDSCRNKNSRKTRGSSGCRRGVQAKGETVEIPGAGAKCYGRRQKMANYDGLPVLVG